MITQTRWQRIEQLFHEAASLDPVPRASFLAQACPDDEERQAVEALLAADKEAGSFIEASAVEFAGGLLPRAGALSGQRIGAYRLLREVGRGGMGAVYLAERADEHFRQRVAIKLVKRGMDTDDILHRFRYERQILASLDHPNIARLLDGGATDDGRPYLVMEYIEGVPIDEYCNRRQLGVAARLRLFLLVCEAVQYAHRNLVVHRDLKPSNILVTPSEDGKAGAPKLLDFGIAKLLNPADPAAPTLSGLRPMTPEYASPEHAHDGLITTASDVYSLGVVLYELLTGRLPYSFNSRDPAEIRRVIATQEATRPSEQVEQTRRQLTGDLDNIVLKALHKEPSRRYDSVERFAEDIHRHLCGLPVMARGDAFGYRAGKFIWRHRAALTAMALVVLTLFGGVAATVHSAQLARAAQDKAERERTVAEAQRMRAESEQAKAETQQLRAENEQAYAESQRLLAEKERARAEKQSAKAVQALVIAKQAQLKAEQEQAKAEAERVRAERRFNEVRKLANTFLFDFHSAIADLPGSTSARQLVVKKAVEYLDGLAAEAGDDLSLQRELAASYQQLGAIQSTGNSGSAHLGKSADALASYRKAIALRESLVARNSANSQMRNDLAASYQALSLLLLDTGDEVGAFENMNKALAMREAAADTGNSQSQFNLMAAHRLFFFIAANTGHPSEALKNLRYAVELGETLVAAQPNNRQLRLQLAITQMTYAPQAWNQGYPDEAWENFRKARQAFEEAVVALPTSQSVRSNLMLVYSGIGDLMMQAGNPNGALEIFRQARALAETNLAEDAANAQARRNLSISYERIGDALIAVGEVNESLNYYRRFVAMLEEIAAADKLNTRYGRDLGESYTKLGRLLLTKGDTAEALTVARKAQAIYEDILRQEPKNMNARRQYAQTLHLLAASQVKIGQNAEARTLTIQALAIQKTEADRPETLGLIANEYAWPLLTCEPKELRDPVAALRYAKLAAERTRNNDPNILKTLALAYHLTGDQTAALETAKKVLSLLPQHETERSLLHRELDELLTKIESAENPH